jgi:flavin-dependent dehydrogenase
VNPTLLKLVQQRGDIDCGGMQYVIIRYGNFYQWVTPIKDGHVSIGLELSMKKDEIEPLIDSWIRKLSR